MKHEARQIDDHAAHLESALRATIAALGMVNVRCWNVPQSPLKPLGDIAREALESVAQIIGHETYDRITSEQSDEA